MCFTGSDIRVYDTTAGSNQVALNRVVSAYTGTMDTCSGSCYSGTFAWDGVYFYFTHAGSSSSNLSYTVLNINGGFHSTYVATGSGAISGTYFDWSVGRYTTHDGWGARSGGTTYTPSNGSASDDSQSYSFPSSVHTF